jgi:hypothetical protein
MIQATNAAKQNSAAAAGTTGRPATKSVSTPSFIDLFRGKTAEQSKTAAKAQAAAGTKAAAEPGPAPIVSKAAASTQAEPAGLPPAFSSQAVENHMNQWLMGVLQQQNDIRSQLYNQAVDGWKNCNARNRELGLPEAPPPPPPELVEVAPMPPGWWSQCNS